MKLKRMSIVILLIITLAQYLAFMPVNAEERLLSSNFEFGRKLDLRGVFASERFYFTVDKFWDVKSSIIRLSMTQSELVDGGELSTITVYLNGHPVTSRRLKDFSAHRSFIEIPLFTDYLKTEVNEIKIEVYRRTSYNQCSDDISSSNWVTFHENSSVNLQYTEKPATNIIGEYPYPFFRQSTALKPDCAIVIPNNPDVDEIKAALILSTAFGQYSQGKECDVTIRKYNDINDKEAWNIIYLGIKKNTPSEISALIPNPEDKTAVLKRLDSPFNPAKKFFGVTSQEGADLVKATQLLTNSELVYQIKSDTYVLNRDFDVLTKQKEKPNSVTLESLGYNGIELTGQFRQASTINIRLPKNKMLDDQSRVIINMRYSENLDFNRSLMTVFVNSVPIGSRKLSREMSQNDTLTLQIPKEARKTSNVELKIAFDLELNNVDCTQRKGENPWAYIKGDSYLFIPVGNMSNYIFQNIPSPFIGDDMWNNVLFVMPDNPNNADLETMADIACAFGREIRSNRGIIDVIKGGALTNEQQKMNIITLGTPNSNSFIKKINNNMYFKYDNAFDYFLSNEKISLVKEYSKTISTIQLLNSPYEKTSAILLLTASDSKNLKEASSYISNPQLSYKLIGDGSFVDPWGELKNFRFKADDVSKGSNSSTTTMIMFFLSFAGLFIIVLVFALVVYNKRHRKL